MKKNTVLDLIDKKKMNYHLGVFPVSADHRLKNESEKIDKILLGSLQELWNMEWIVI